MLNKKIIISFISTVAFVCTGFAAQDPNDAAIAQFQADLDKVQSQKMPAISSDNLSDKHSSSDNSDNNLQSNQAATSSPSLENSKLSQGGNAADSVDANPFAQDASADNTVIDPNANNTIQDYMNAPATGAQQAAFSGMTQQAMPMTPEQIVQLKKMLAASQRASATPVETPPKPVTSSLFVNLSPGSTPPVVRLSSGFISSLVFVDATGAAWPIVSYDNGNPDAFNVAWDKKSNTLMIQAKKSYTYGNLAITLKGLDTPIMLTLIPGQKTVDYRVDLRVSGLAPGSKDNVGGDNLPKTANSTLLKVLDGVAPENSTEMDVPGGQAQAWLDGSTMYLRTKYTLLSPGYKSRLRSPDGTYAYELSDTPTVLISQYGNPTQLEIKAKSNV